VSVAGAIGRATGGSLVQRAMDAVTGHIREHGLRVGDSLPGEAHFAASLGVSRAVMREAFGALAALRLIDVANGRKPRVGALDGAVIAASLDHGVSTAQVSVAEVWDVRRTIELRTAELAATARSDEEAERIVGLAEAMAADLNDFERLTQHDIAFHETIARASHNALFVQIVASFAPLMAVAVPAAWHTRVAEQRREIMIERHRAVAKAIRRRDPVAAVRAMSAHFDASIGDLLRAHVDGQ
jgi:GntR family transcriptional regulator, transcriptional repressor for pyruvate dehydrogenase complex